MKGVDLLRTFSKPRHESEDYEDWAQYFDAERHGLKWSDVHKKRVAVVVGEAGIGKTIEFKNETERLRRIGKAAFFVELNQLGDNDSWSLALGESASTFEAWQESSEDGYFFLDAVDEARLRSHASMKKALQVASARLRPYFSRVRVAISSRWTDWSIDDVRMTIVELLIVPIEVACRPKPKVADTVSKSPAGLRFEESPLEEHVEIFVVSIAPLTIPEAKKLADAWSLPHAAEFWAAIESGGYRHLATRPLDLNWMVSEWKKTRSLGTYQELIEGSVSNRLIDTNPSYQASGTVLSPQQLRDGAELLAAATELSGRSYVSCGQSLTVRGDEVAPQEVLTDWSGSDVARLLASALFDEATFGRVKFHHRTVRAYLAACWICRNLLGGIPLHRFLPLFVASPFGDQVLIPTRRWTLCWLAAINVKAREWVVRHFPEMLLFDGDPQAWDALSADEAFEGYLQRRNHGFMPDWYNDSAEFMRVGKRLSPGLVSEYLSNANVPNNEKVSLLPIVTHARLTDCATAVFNLYADPVASAREKLRALDALKTIATIQQRDAIKSDLLSGSLTSNEFAASALVATDWAELGVADLIRIFMMTASENAYGHGPMARALTEDILPAATLKSANAILEAVLACSPAASSNEGLVKYPESSQPLRAWLLEVLPIALGRLLSTLNAEDTTYATTCLEAAERVESLRHVWYSDNQQLKRIHDEIAGHDSLRWRLALTFAKSPHISHATARMCWSGCLVTFDAADLPELTSRANNPRVSPADRDVWFKLAREVAMSHLVRYVRKKALAALAVGPGADSRLKAIVAHRISAATSLAQNRKWKVQQRQSEHEILLERKKATEKIRADIEHVRDASHTGTLCWLIQYSYDHSGRNDIFRVDYGVIARDLGEDLADACSVGLQKLWHSAHAPNPADYSNGVVPWEAITGLAGFYTALKNGRDIQCLSRRDVARAARFAVWELKRPPDWFERLAAADGPGVEEALHPWIVAEAQSNVEATYAHRALDLALGCRGEVRARLLKPLVSSVLNQQIGSPETFKNLLNALREEELVSSSNVEELCRAQLIGTGSTEELLPKSYWLRAWLEENTQNAWVWFEANLPVDDVIAKTRVKQFVEELSDFKWVRMPADDSTVNILMRLHALILKHRSPADVASERENADVFDPSMTRVLETIPGILLRTPGYAAHKALVKLASAETDAVMSAWLSARVHEHSALQSSQAAHTELSSLRSIASPLGCEPQSEGHLFEQVLARLEELRNGLEDGPFSDRGLFHKGMRETLLQVWLAARFRDTPNGRFSVHREEEVDEYNETDIQLSARGWNVCIEIKPVDGKRSYSAASLVATIREQLVGQYLKGFNSSHGILVLIRLDKKTWEIPGVGKRRPFSALVQYLKEQAEIIKAECPHVAQLIVFPIDCT